MHHTILRLSGTSAALGDSRSTVYRHVDDELLTRQIRLGRRCVGWPAHEIEAIAAARIAGWTDDQIRGLVRRLTAARATIDPDMVASSPAEAGSR